MAIPFPPLQIAIVGAGNIGSAFAVRLSRVGGHVVTVVARPGSVRLEQLRRDSAIVDVNGVSEPVIITDTLDEQVPYDLLIVTTLAHQVDAILPSLQRSAAQCIQFMFNTFDPERLQDAIGIERCAFGMPFVQASLDGDGRLKATVGAAGQKTIMNRQSSVDIFNAAGLPAVLETHMPLWLRSHVPMCVAFESVSAASVRRDAGASWSEARALARGVHAGFDLVKGLGGEIYPSNKRRLAGAPIAVVAAILWFVSRIRPFRELLATGKAECIALVDAMVAAAERGKSSVDLSVITSMKPS